MSQRELGELHSSPSPFIKSREPPDGFAPGRPRQPRGWFKPGRRGTEGCHPTPSAGRPRRAMVSSRVRVIYGVWRFTARVFGTKHHLEPVKACASPRGRAAWGKVPVLNSSTPRMSFEKKPTLTRTFGKRWADGITHGEALWNCYSRNSSGTCSGTHYLAYLTKNKPFVIP